MATVPRSGRPRRSWFSRHPVLTALGFAAGVGLAVIVAIAAFVSGVLRNSDPAKMAIHQAELNPVVVSRLGTPLKMGLFASGYFRVADHSGSADFHFPVTGPHGKGTIYVTARKKLGRWELTALEIDLDNDAQSVDLLPPAPQVQ